MSDSEVGPLLSDAEVSLLTDARTKRWTLEQYEHAYEWSLSWYRNVKRIVSFIGPAAAIIFLYLRWAVPDSNTTVQFWLSIVATGLTVVSLLFLIWINLGRWDTIIERMQALSEMARELIKSHSKLAAKRPVDRVKIQKWQTAFESYEQDRKDQFASVSALAIKRGFQHVGKLHPDCGVKCSVCQKTWTPESNRRAKWSWVPLFGCKHCGV